MYKINFLSKNSVAFSPQANYTGRATTACQRSNTKKNSCEELEHV
jgi:hypothetical protein